MGFCTNCGSELPENSRFCTKCGTPVNNTLNGSQVSKYDRNVIAGKIAVQRTVTGNAVERAVGSTLYLVAISANSIYLLLSLMKLLTSGITSTANDYMGHMMDLIGYSGYFNYLGMLETGAKVISFLFMLPPILFCIGTWMIYGVVKGKLSNADSGFSLARIGIMIQLVGYSVLFGIILIVCIFAGIVAEELGAVIILIILSVLLGTLIIQFYWKELCSLRIVQNNMKDGHTETLSTYVAVIGFIVGVLSVFGLFGTNGFFSVISAIARIIWIFSASIWVVQYKNY